MVTALWEVSLPLWSWQGSHEYTQTVKKKLQPNDFRLGFQSK